MSTYRDICLLVPIQYKYGLAGTQVNFASAYYYDGDPNTSSSAVTGSGTVSSMTLVSSATPTRLFVDSDAQVGTTVNTGYFTAERSTTELTIASYHAEVGKSSYWTISSGTRFKRNTSLTTGELSIMLELTNSTAGTVWAVDYTPAVTPVNTKRGYVWSEDFTVPLFLRGKKTSHSFDVDLGRTETGSLFNDWRKARSRQVVRNHSFQWSGLNHTDFTTFLDFFEAFGNNIERPFIMVRRTNDGSAPNYEMEFWRLIINERSITYGRGKGNDKTNLYDVSFTATEQRIDY